MKTLGIIFPEKKRAEVIETEVPRLKPDEVLAKTVVNGICMWELHCFHHMEDLAGYRPGHEGIGVVEEVGSEVKDIAPGDYITTLEWGQYTVQKRADLIKVAPIPKGTDAGIYMLEPLACVINAVGHTPLYPANKVFISGSGYMGLMLLKLLSGYPLSRIVVSDIKPENLALAKRFGADELINVADAAQVSALEDDGYHATFECSGSAAGLSLCNRLTARGGSLGIYAWHHGTREVDTNSWHEKGLRILNLTPGITANEKRFRSFQAAADLTASGKFSQEGLITHRYTIHQAQQAMEDSTTRGVGFIKSIFEF